MSQPADEHAPMTPEQMSLKFRFRTPRFGRNGLLYYGLTSNNRTWVMRGAEELDAEIQPNVIRK